MATRGHRIIPEMRVRYGQVQRDESKIIMGNRKIVATHVYRNEDGRPLHRTIRYEPKGFSQEQFDGKNWIPNLNGARLVPYRLPELLSVPSQVWIYICEGEKDVDRLVDLGFDATTNPMGAGKWRQAYNEFFKGKLVAILPDNDNVGYKHALQIAESLYGIALEIRIVSLPGLPNKGDVSDWFDAGHNKSELIQLTDQAAPFKLKTGTIEKTDTFKIINSLQSSIKSGNIICVLEYRPFPTHVFPDPIRGFVTVTSKAIGCDPSYVALPLLAALAGAIGNTRQIKLKDGWTEPSVLWAAIVGESGTMKSPAVEAPLKPVFARQSKAIDGYKERKRQYDSEMQLYEAQLTEWKRNRHKPNEQPPQPPPEPICERFWCNDITV